MQIRLSSVTEQSHMGNLQIMESDNYASHLIIFEKVFSTFQIKKVLEFGLGKFCTPFFVKHTELVVSVEQESKE